jgi:hypothetical protein
VHSPPEPIQPDPIQVDPIQVEPIQPDPALPGVIQPGLLHPLAQLIIEAAGGRFPAVDGGWHRVPLWHPGLEAVFAFTGHAVLALADDVTDAALRVAGVNGFGGAHDPRLIADLTGPEGWIDSLDAVLVALGTGAGTGSGTAEAKELVQRPDLIAPSNLIDRPDLADHPRVRHAAAIRSQLRVLGYRDPARSAVVIVSTGLAGLTELSFELEPDRRRAGAGIALIRDALTTISPGQPVVACAAPGNAASLRALLANGFVPIGSVQLFRRRPESDPVP